MKTTFLLCFTLTALLLTSTQAFLEEVNIEHLRTYTTDATPWFSNFGSATQETTSTTAPTLDMLIRTKTSTLGVVVFAKTHCTHSLQALQLLSVLKIPHEVVYLDKIPRNALTIHALLTDNTGQETVPYIWIGGEFIGGNDALRSLHKAGKLEALVRNLLVFQQHLYS